MAQVNTFIFPMTQCVKNSHVLLSCDRLAAEGSCLTDNSLNDSGHYKTIIFRITPSTSVLSPYCKHSLEKRMSLTNEVLEFKILNITV